MIVPQMPNFFPSLSQPFAKIVALTRSACKVQALNYALIKSIKCEIVLYLCKIYHDCKVNDRTCHQKYIGWQAKNKHQPNWIQALARFLISEKDILKVDFFVIKRKLVMLNLNNQPVIVLVVYRNGTNLMQTKTEN